MKEFLQQGDVLLFERTHFISHVIGFITRSRYSHAAIYFEEGTFDCVGYNRNTLVNIYGRKLVVFRAKCPPAIRRAAAGVMKKLLGQPYSWTRVFKTYLYRCLPVFLRPAWMNERLSREEYHCSRLVSKAFRLAGYGLVTGKSDWAITPDDIAKSDRVEFIISGTMASIHGCVLK